MGGHQYGFYRWLTQHFSEACSIWVIVDRLTKTAHFIPVNTTYTAKKYAEIYLDQIIRLHGIPKTIISDHGVQFIAHFLE